METDQEENPLLRPFSASNPPPLTGVSDRYQPRTVNPQETVQGQVSGIISKNSPLMKQAATRGKQYANQRGLINSSLGAQATQSSVLDAAMPIAQQDADTFARSAEKEQAFKMQGIMDQNEYAQDRALSLWDKENLAYAQYIKGVADINSQDIKLADKQAGVNRLWEEYKAGRPLASSIKNISIVDGQIQDLLPNV